MGNGMIQKVQSTMRQFILFAMTDFFLLGGHRLPVKAMGNGAHHRLYA
jgi:hypothetical protein